VFSDLLESEGHFLRTLLELFHKLREKFLLLEQLHCPCRGGLGLYEFFLNRLEHDGALPLQLRECL
jgi:hypothetical protein